MTEQTPNANDRKTTTLAVADLGTMALSVAFGVAASYAGPVAVGISVATVTFPFLFSFSGLLNRRYPLPANVSTEEIDWFNKSGLQRTGQALKNIFSDAKRGNFVKAAIAAGMLGGVGLLATATATDAHETARKQEELQRLPVLPSDTQISVNEICKINRGVSFNKPFTHNGTQYRIVCP